MGNVTKKDLVEVISGRTGLTQVDTKVVVETLLETISNYLESGKNIEIRGFGRFKVKVKKGRIARNPRSGEMVEVPAGFKPVFEASKDLKKKINDQAAASKDSSTAGASPTDQGEKPQEPLY